MSVSYVAALSIRLHFYCKAKKKLNRIVNGNVIFQKLDVDVFVNIFMDGLLHVQAI